jgi:hypothetical protein
VSKANYYQPLYSEYVDNRIQDISYENILMNYHGKKPERFLFQTKYEPPIKISPVPEFRSTFPVRYWLMDFGYSIYFPPGVASARRFVKGLKIGRPHRAPETGRSVGYCPFAADVYQAARLFYAWFKVRCCASARAAELTL